jgi:hypothetical protein
MTDDEAIAELMAAADDCENGCECHQGDCRGHESAHHERSECPHIRAAALRLLAQGRREGAAEVPCASPKTTCHCRNALCDTGWARWRESDRCEGERLCESCEARAAMQQETVK